MRSQSLRNSSRACVHSEVSCTRLGRAIATAGGNGLGRARPRRDRSHRPDRLNAAASTGCASEPRHYPRQVHLYTDESGDFLFPDDGFDCYSQAVVICPDSCLGLVSDFVSGRCGRWGLEELHAHRMTGQMLLEVCDFISESGCGLLAMVTDTELVSADDIFRFRLAQAAANKRGLDRYHAEGGRSEEIAAITDRNIKRVGLEAQIQDGQFIQAHFLVLLLGRGLQKAVLWYQADEWDEDLARFTFVVDRKLPGKLSTGEKYLHEIIVPALASREEALDIPKAWHERPDHPFLMNFERESAWVRGRDVSGAIDLRAIFEGGVRFEDSGAHPGLQLADTVAHVVRRAVLEPQNAIIRAAYDQLRPQLRNEDDRCLLINRLQGSAPPVSLERYRHVHGPAPDRLLS